MICQKATEEKAALVPRELDRDHKASEAALQLSKEPLLTTVVGQRTCLKECFNHHQTIGYEAKAIDLGVPVSKLQFYH